MIDALVIGVFTLLFLFGWFKFWLSDVSGGRKDWERWH